MSLSYAKQNRIVNATILVPAREKVEVPVSCAERGRWRFSEPRKARGRVYYYVEQHSYPNHHLQRSLLP